MASNINSSNINGAYPVAGQDNDSQGFRDNFTNIRTNFTSASTEISELQSKAVLKSALTGTTLDNNLTGVLLSYAQTKGFTDTMYPYSGGNPYTGTASLSFANGDYQKINVAGSITLAFTNWPLTGLHAKMRVLLSSVDVTDLIIFPASVNFGLNAIPGAWAGHTLTPLAGDYLLEFSTDDAGSNVAVAVLIAPASNTTAAFLALNANIASVQSNVSTLQSNVSTLQGNISTLTSGLANVVSNVTTLQSFVTTSLSSENLISGNAASLSVHTSYFNTGPGISIPLNETFLTANIVGATLSGNVSYSYRVSAINTYGETLASPQTSITTGGSDNSVTISWEEVPASTGYKVYGRTAGAQLLLTAISGNTTLSWIDNGSITPSGTLSSRDTTNPGTATLAIGSAGQVKAFSAANIAAGNMVITVSNVGWKDAGSGTITFDARGVGCTVQYVDSKWFCIGNNGAVFG